MISLADFIFSQFSFIANKMSLAINTNNNNFFCYTNIFIKDKNIFLLRVLINVQHSLSLYLKISTKNKQRSMILLTKTS